MTRNSLFEDWGSAECPICNSPQCGKWFRKVETYHIWVCSRCYRANRNGWSLEAERVLIPYMEGLRLPLPDRNADCWLPFEVPELVMIVLK